MKFRKITAEFDAADVEIAEELICNAFFSFSLKGVICDVPIPEPDEGFGTDTLPLPAANAIIGYLPDMDASDHIIDQIEGRLAALCDAGICVRTRIDIVDERDWADAWKDYFNVTRITDRIVVKPEWKPHAPGPEDIVIHIDPGMAFGTGTHPTTAMCLELIEKHLVPGQNLLDVGCGSGILMIAAAKLGAGQLDGIDTDPMAVDITRENLEKNQIDPACFTLSATTLDRIPPAPYDLVVANIIAQVIVDIAPDLKARLAPGGTAILSGIILERQPDVMKALTAQALELVAQRQEGDWVAMVVRHRNANLDR